MSFIMKNFLIVLDLIKQHLLSKEIFVVAISCSYTAEITLTRNKNVLF